MRTVSTIVVSVLLAGCFAEPAHVSVSTPKERIVTLCELAKQPDAFSGRDLQLRAVYRTAFETSTFVSAECPDAGRVWVEFAPDFETCSDAGARQVLDKITLASRGDSATVGLIVRGRFESTHPPYGPLRNYTAQFRVSCVEHAELLGRGDSPAGSAPGTLEDRIRSFERGR